MVCPLGTDGNHWQSQYRTYALFTITYYLILLKGNIYYGYDSGILP